MDIWKFFDITHRNHLFCNPLNAAKIDEMIGLLQLPPKAHVLELAAGKDDPDVPDLQQQVAEQKLAYLRWGRETLGWALYLFQA